MRFMEAHGYSPAPTQRPLLTGTASGVLAEIAALPLFYYSGAAISIAAALGMETSGVFALYAISMAIAGALYGRIFMRAANDARGGWLFGVSYGFLLWMLGPVTVMQWITGKPVAIGAPAIGLLGTQLLYGLVLGAVFPWVHRVFQPKIGGRLQRNKSRVFDLRHWRSHRR